MMIANGRDSAERDLQSITPDEPPAQLSSEQSVALDALRGCTDVAQLYELLEQNKQYMYKVKELIQTNREAQQIAMNIINADVDRKVQNAKGVIDYELPIAGKYISNYNAQAVLSGVRERFQTGEMGYQIAYIQDKTGLDCSQALQNLRSLTDFAMRRVNED